jgi:hypothetical protein
MCITTVENPDLLRRRSLNCMPGSLKFPKERNNQYPTLNFQFSIRFQLSEH